MSTRASSSSTTGSQPSSVVAKATDADFIFNVGHFLYSGTAAESLIDSARPSDFDDDDSKLKNGRLLKAFFAGKHGHHTSIDPKNEGSIRTVREALIATMRWGSKQGMFGPSRIEDGAHSSAEKQSSEMLSNVLQREVRRIQTLLACRPSDAETDVMMPSLRLALPIMYEKRWPELFAPDSLCQPDRRVAERTLTSKAETQLRSILGDSLEQARNNWRATHGDPWPPGPVEYAAVNMWAFGRTAEVAYNQKLLRSDLLSKVTSHQAAMEKLKVVAPMSGVFTAAMRSASMT